jgi:hypothetical protein
LGFIRMMITNESCREDIKAFTGCLFAVREMALMANENWALVPRNAASGRNLLRDLGTTVVVESPSAERGDPKVIAAFVSEWKKVFDSNEEVDFEKVMEALIPEARNHVSEPHLVGESINAYFKGNIDPHTYVIPVAQRGQSFASAAQASEPPTVRQAMYDAAGTPVGYISLSTFTDGRACRKIKAAIRELTTAGAMSLVFDLRGNGGGDIDVAICVANIFLEEGLIVTKRDPIEGSGSESHEAYKTLEPAFTKLPLVMLVDAGSASASELVTSALQDYGRALVAGERTYGKGTMQEGSPLVVDETVKVNDQSTWKVMLFRTVARYLRPKGGSVQLVGVEPDVVISQMEAEGKVRIVREAEQFEPLARPSVVSAVAPAQPGRTQEIKRCAERSTVAEDLYAGAVKAGAGADFQLASAVELAYCDGLYQRAGEAIVSLFKRL